jgi:hypothetical protein
MMHTDTAPAAARRPNSPAWGAVFDSFFPRRVQRFAALFCCIVASNLCLRVAFCGLGDEDQTRRFLIIVPTLLAIGLPLYFRNRRTRHATRSGEAIDGSDEDYEAVFEMWSKGMYDGRGRRVGNTHEGVLDAVRREGWSELVHCGDIVGVCNAAGDSHFLVCSVPGEGVWAVDITDLVAKGAGR